MSKELEALNDLGSRLASVDTSSTIEEDHDDVFPIIRKALTPPTQEEVCKALRKWIDENAMMTYSEVYYDDKKKSFEVGQYEPSVCYKDDEIIWFNWFRLPPHLITLIGRFYEGLEK